MMWERNNHGWFVVGKHDEHVPMFKDEQGRTWIFTAGVEEGSGTKRTGYVLITEKKRPWDPIKQKRTWSTERERMAAYLTSKGVTRLKWIKKSKVARRRLVLYFRGRPVRVIRWKPEAQWDRYHTLSPTSYTLLICPETGRRYLYGYGPKQSPRNEKGIRCIDRRFCAPDVSKTMPLLFQWGPEDEPKRVETAEAA